MRNWVRTRRRTQATGGVGTAPAAVEGSIIGDLEGPVAVVDERGRVQTCDRGWSFEWGVGIGDRWRVAHVDPGARRHRIDDAPVYETRLRVPTGDVVHRVAVANDGVSRVLVIEFENMSSDAVAVALVGRAHGVELQATRDAVTLGGQVWIQPERRAGGAVAVSGAQDPWSKIRRDPPTAAVSARGDEVAAGLVMALPHRQTVKFGVVIAGTALSRPANPAEIASGWRAVTAETLTIDVADADLGVAWRRILGDLVVQAGSDDPRSAAETAPILDIAGLDREADRARAVVVSSAESGLLTGSAAVAALRALASRELRIGRDSGLNELADVLVAGASDSLDRDTANQLARALEAGPPRVAADAERLAASVDPNVVYQPSTLAATAADRVLGTLIDDSRPDHIDLLPEIPPEWFSRPIDVRGFGTLWGRMSFSVRWHGHRPALLWERAGSHDNVELRCRGIDPSWSSVERQGETLLAEPDWARHA